MVSQTRALSRHPDFLKLWTGETVSLFGSQVTLLALPLTAVLLLGASAVEMGILTAAGSAPFLLVGLSAGVWVDRRRRRPILIWSNVGRALLLATIPLSAVFGVLRMEELYLTAFAVGILTVFFDVAYMACLPSLVPREQLVDGNAKLELSRSLAQMHRARCGRWPRSTGGRGHRRGRGCRQLRRLAGAVSLAGIRVGGAADGLRAE